MSLPLSLPQSPHLTLDARSISSRFPLRRESGAHRLEIGPLLLTYLFYEGTYVSIYDVSPLDGSSHGDDEVYFFPLHEPSRDPWHTRWHTARLRALERVPCPPLPPEPESTCYLPRRAPINMPIRLCDITGGEM